MILVVFQTQHVRANPPSGANEYNHALAKYGGIATASGSSGSTTPGMAIDGNMSTYWQSSTTTGWLAVSFPTYAYLNVVHVHFYSTSKIYPKLSLYYDLNGNGVYETSEKVWSTTSNTVLDVLINTAMKSTLGIKVTIDAYVGSNLPMIAEFEAYLQNDTDGDGLTNAQETSTTYYQDMGAGSLPSAIPDDGVNASSNAVSLTQFYGNGVVALANFTVDHARKTDLTAQVGYWNGTAWVDRYVWDPGRRLDSVSLTQPLANSYVTGTVTVVATVLHPEITSKVEFRVAGVLQATLTTPAGNNFQWTWSTGFPEGPTKLNATQYDTAGGKAWSEITVNVVQPPQTTWVSPTSGATVSGTVTVKVTATDYYGISSVTFYVDGTYQAQVWTPNSGPNGYAWSWSTAQYCTNAQHTIAALVTEGAPLYLTSSPSASVTAATYPLVCITAPSAGAYVANTVSVVASPTAAPGKSITKVDFYLSASFQYEATASPWAWSWDTTLGGNGVYTLSVIATDSASSTASAATTVHVSNSGGSCTKPPCPVGPVGGNLTPLGASGVASQPTATLGVLASDWARGETDSGTKATVVVDLTGPAALASSAENASRILRPALPLSLFATYLQWHLVIRDWAIGTAGNVTAFTLRFEVRSDPNNPDTDGDGIPDGTEVNLYHTLPVARDSDLDGLADNYEITPHSETVTVNGVTRVLAPFTTNATRWDTDGDGLGDGQERGLVSFGMTKVIGEVGTVSGVTTSIWTTVYLHNRYTAPLVFAEPASFHDTAFSHVRIQAVTDHTFQLRMEKWVSGGTGASESVAYLVLESGDHILPDGSFVEAGTAAVGPGTTPTTVTFRESYWSDAPYVLVQTQTANNGATAVIANRTALNWTGSFGVRLNGNASTNLVSETVGYVAISPQSNARSLATWTRAEASFPSNQVQGAWTYPAKFAQPQAPLILAWMGPETTSGTRNLGLRLKSATNGSATVYREQYGTPTADKVDFFAFAGPMNVTARMTTNPLVADTDGDTLPDGKEVTTYGSNPTLKDTDADGIPDNVEVTPRSTTIPVNGALQTITFTTSPTSPDTDADGIPDLQEIQGVLDHRVLYYDMATLSSGSVIRDLSGNGADGTLRYVQRSTTGMVGGSIVFNGTTGSSANRIQVPSTPWLNLTDGFTLMAWVASTAPSQGATLIAKGYGNTASFALDIVMSGSKYYFRAYVNGVSSQVVSSNAITTGLWYLVAVSYDAIRGTLSLSVNAGNPSTISSVPAISTNAHDLTIGSREWSSSSGYNMSFKGYLDEVQIWDRPLSRGEVSASYNLTSTSGYLARLDFETLTAGGQLFDFGGGTHYGTSTGTKVVEGRTGLARSFAGGLDGISLANPSTLSITAGVTVDVYVSLPSLPANDTAIIARKGSFYLNVSSDGLVRWSLYKGGTITSGLPVAQGRWVRITATATASAMNLYLDGLSAATGSTTSFTSSSNLVTVGYTEGQAHLVGSLDEFTLLNSAVTASTVTDAGPRGIQLNPNSTDTDGDGLADGQELYTYTVKTPLRYPVPDSSSTTTDPLAVSLGAPAWAIGKALAMVGITHPDMGQVSDNLYFRSGVKSVQSFNLKLAGSNAGQANNFTSYDLFQLGLSRSTLAASLANAYVVAWDNWGDGKGGQVEYVQLQFTVHTRPDRADTDKDGLNDSEEVNLGHDGFVTNPWKADTDADGVPDGLESSGWSWSGSTIVSDPNGIKTDPTRADTDRDGVPDGRDRAPLGDAFIRIMFQTAVIYGGSDDDTTPSLFEPFASVHVGNQTAYTKNTSVASGSTAYMVFVYVANVPDDQTNVPIAIEVWDYDAVQSNGYPDDTHERFAVNGSSLTWNFNHPLATVGVKQYQANGTGSFRAEHVSLTVETVYPYRMRAYMIVPRDYSSIYNVTNAAGSTTSRRYVGEPRMVAVLLNVSQVVHQATLHYQEVIFVPRSVFFDTILYRRLANRDTTWPLTNLGFRQNSTSALTNADDLQEILSANVSGDEATAILGLLYLNTTSTPQYRLIDVDLNASQDTLFMYTLPDGALRLIGYTPFAVDSSVRYRFCSSPNCGVNPVDRPWWEQIWDGIVSIVTAFVTSALVLAATAFAMISAVLSQVGNWIAQAFSAAAQAVSSAVQAAAKVVGQFLSAALNFVESIVRQAVDFIVKPLLQMLKTWAGEIQEVISRILTAGDTDELDASMIDGVIFGGAVATMANILATAIEVVIGVVLVVAIVFPGAEGLSVIIKQVILKVLEAAEEHWLSSTLLSIGMGAVIGAIIPKDTTMWGITSAVGTLFVGLLVTWLQKIVAKRLHIPSDDLDSDRIGLWLSLLGFFLAVTFAIVAPIGPVAVVMAWVGAVLSGLGMLIALFGHSWNDALPMGIGYADELVTAATFGFSFGVAVTTK